MEINSVTLILVSVISVISIICFYSASLMSRFQFSAFQVYHKKQYYRLLSHAFLHANWEHLIVNMIVLLSFGSVVEKYFQYYFGTDGNNYYLLLFFGSVIFSSLWSLYNEKNNFYYNAVGASGAVSAILFTAIFFDPWSSIYFFGILPIPGILFGGLYLYYSWYMSRKKLDNVGHDAHFLGALFGFFLPMIIRPSLLMNFIDLLFRSN